ncbi:phosphatidylglycerol lysyltransferase domain-containing protein [Rubellimicrobium roseum]|uniref:DUF2156 domain-containing protein n=1 Tax=Rubellimicrobium roseum TaxID=687525 RepID=A0A5C4NBQ8_9RHOB|nr:phosphatidylglycerol lysyltransferase domain-containing protein [Rubellimicrobium roseum]TNC68053.1 DUF2156 domain-containing protein [Rubellimicrobium roseum]
MRLLPLSPLLDATGPSRDRALARAPQAEWGLAHQGARILLSRDQATSWLVRRAGACLVALGRPLGAADLGAFARTARRQGLRPVLYKCDAPTASAARAAGWRVVRVGHEAVLDLATWSADRPACRQLRRKLRAASAAGVEVTPAAELPLARMEAVARDWAACHGGERGFSMGRFDPRLLGRQQVLLAWAGGRLVAFASFHTARNEWTLDLMRHSGAPDGTMHALIAEAVIRARAAGVARLSLAAIPEPTPGRSWLRALGLGSCGLAQFKGAFGPRHLPRYAAAPGRLALALGLASVARAIRRPGPLPPSELRSPVPPTTWRTRRLETRRPAPHFGFEPAPVPCDARPAQPRPAPRALSGQRPPP